MGQVEINSAIDRLKFENPEAYGQLRHTLRSLLIAKGYKPQPTLGDRVFAWVVVSLIIGANLFFVTGIIKVHF